MIHGCSLLGNLNEFNNPSKFIIYFSFSIKVINIYHTLAVKYVSFFQPLTLCVYNKFSSKYVQISVYSTIFLSSLVNSINEDGILCTVVLLFSISFFLGFWMQSSSIDFVFGIRHLLKHLLILLCSEVIFNNFCKFGVHKANSEVKLATITSCYSKNKEVCTYLECIRIKHLQYTYIF